MLYEMYEINGGNRLFCEGLINFGKKKDYKKTGIAAFTPKRANCISVYDFAF